MVCRHCMEALLSVCKTLDLEVKSVELGEVVVFAEAEQIDYPRLRKLLQENGFELLEDKDQQIVEAVKTAVIAMIRESEGMPEVKNSVYLEEKLGVPYNQLSRVFSKLEHLTIERYIILQKIERVKELLSYDEFSGSEIAYQLGYSSLQHLSNQFKSVTGMSVSAFKKLKDKGRKAINEIK